MDKTFEARHPTIRMLALELGLSKSAVALALNNDPQLPVATRQRVQATAQKLGYQRNPTISHLMTELRGSRMTAHKATLAFIHGKENRNDMRTHRISILLFEGARDRASTLGYALDPFWLYDPALPPEKLRAALRARNIRGLIFNNSEQDDGLLPKAVHTIVRDYPCVFDCITEHNPVFHYCGCDNFSLTWNAIRHAHRLGYRRPALLLSHRTHVTSNSELMGGYLAGLGDFLPDALQSIGTHLFLALPDSTPEAHFAQWYSRGHPDVILYHEFDAQQWLAKLNQRVPQDVGLINIDLAESETREAGMIHNHRTIGARTVDILVSLILAGERGPVIHPACTQVEATWRHGKTVRRQTPKSAPPATRRGSGKRPR
jgi:LacI family transcriptional regulator